MSGTKQERFRITAWPGVIVPTPPCRRSRGYRLDEENEVLLPMKHPRHTDVTVPSGEIYLRLAQVDLDDPHAILEFVNTFAILGVIQSKLGWPSFHLPSGGEDEMH